MLVCPHCNNELDRAHANRGCPAQIKKPSRRFFLMGALASAVAATVPIPATPELRKEEMYLFYVSGIWAATLIFPGYITWQKVGDCLPPPIKSATLTNEH
jgi:hypothetical protein